MEFNPNKKKPAKPAKPKKKRRELILTDLPNACSAVLSADLAKLGQWVELDDQSYEPIVQGMVLLKNGRSPEEHGRKFLEFIFSTEGRGILERYGYQSP